MSDTNRLVTQAVRAHIRSDVGRDIGLAERTRKGVHAQMPRPAWEPPKPAGYHALFCRHGKGVWEPCTARAGASLSADGTQCRTSVEARANAERMGISFTGRK